MKVKGAIFDVDGTLLDTMRFWTDSGARYLKTLGITAEPHLGDKLFAMTADGGAEYLKKNYNLELSYDEIKKGILSMVEQAYYELADFKPGARELLDKMKENEIPMTIASSTDSCYIHAALRRLGYDDYFEKILSCSAYNTTKGEPKIFYEAVKIMGTEIEDTWVYEDGLYSIKTAKAAGFRTVGVYDKVSLKDQEEIKKTADVYVNNLTEYVLE